MAEFDDHPAERLALLTIAEDIGIPRPLVRFYGITIQGQPVGAMYSIRWGRAGDYRYITIGEKAHDALDYAALRELIEVGYRQQDLMEAIDGA